MVKLHATLSGVVFLLAIIVMACGGDGDGSEVADETATSSPTGPSSESTLTPTATTVSTDLPQLPQVMLETVLLHGADLGWSGEQVQPQHGTSTVDTASFCDTSPGTIQPPLARVKFFITTPNTENLNENIALLRPGQAARLLASTQSDRDSCTKWEGRVSGQPWSFENEPLDIAGLGDTTVAVRTRYTKQDGTRGAQDYVGVWLGDYVVQIWYTADGPDHDPAFAKSTITQLVERLEDLLGR